jgi:hypothetical protein
VFFIERVNPAAIAVSTIPTMSVAIITSIMLWPEFLQFLAGVGAVGFGDLLSILIVMVCF